MRKHNRRLVERLLLASLILIVGIIITEYFNNKTDINLAYEEENTYSYNEIPDIVQENTSKEIQAYFCNLDNCTAKLIELIGSSNTTHCALFDLSLKGVIDALNRSFLEGKDVKLIVDNENYKKVSSLEFAKQDTSSQLSHNKFCIFDFDNGNKIEIDVNNQINSNNNRINNKKNIVLTGSFNPTGRAYVNDNNIIILQSQYIASNYENEFNELWNGIFSKGNAVKYPITILNGIKIENYFCPEDRCEMHSNEILKQANKSIYFMAFSFTSDVLANTIVKKHNQNKGSKDRLMAKENSEIEVLGIYEKSQASIWKEYTYLTDTPLKIFADKNRYNMHHKVFIIDNATVITGSYNPTKGGNNKNDENILIIHDKKIADKFAKEFFRIYNLANSKNENI